VTPDFHDEQALGRVYDSRLLRRLWPFLSPHRRLLALGLALIPLRMGVQLLSPLLFGAGVAFMLNSEPTPSVARLLPWITMLPGDPLLVTAASLFLVTLALALLDCARGLTTYTMGQRAMFDMREVLFDHVQRLPMRFFDKYPVGRLVTRLTNDVETLAEMFSGGIVALLTDLLAIVAIAVVLFSIDARLALISMAVVPVLAAAAVIFRWKVRESFRLVRTRIARINAHLQETISGMKEVQLFAREQRNFETFEAVNRAHRDAWFTSIRYDALLSSLIEFATSLTAALIFWRGAALMGVESLGVDVLFVFIEYMRRFFQPLQDLSARYSVMQSSMASCERIFELLDVPTEIPATSSTSAPLGAPVHVEVGEVERPQAAAGAAAPQRGEVVFDDVSFAYGSELVLRGVSLRVAPGERVAIVGHTGSGKTTLLKLLARLYDVSSGDIRIDGRSVRELERSELRRRMAFVLQDVFLFGGSLEYNISLGRKDLSPQQVQRAIAAARADALVERLPDGLAQHVRERGLNFSGGERQLLSFARALVREPDILLLDEATSSVDTETEGRIQEALAELLEDKTAIVVAHRLSTIQDADRIYVMHHGQLRESGSHDELLEARGLYWRLYQLQYASQERAA